jgi:transposase, IS30 family
LPSSRRVKKGPGRRPQSAKRQRFVELRERGWSILAAAREVGVSRTTGNNWSRGYKTYRHGQVAGFVSALERLAVRQISPRFLSQDERIEIVDLRHAGLTIRQIAHRLGRAPSTVSRELRRNATRSLGYRPFDAHRRATARRVRNHRRRIETNGELRQIVAELLAQRWSPQQISRHLRLKFPALSGMWLCHESIYQAVYQPGSGLLRPSRLAPHHRSPLRTGRDHRRAQQRTERRRPRFEYPMLTIHQRPFPPEDRSQPGHWEGDLIIGKDQRSAIGTLVERQTRWSDCCIFLSETATRCTTHSSCGWRTCRRRCCGRSPGTREPKWPVTSPSPNRSARRSTPATPAHPGKRGSNENANGLLRDYFPKSTDLSTHSTQHLLAVENELNNRPRLILNDHAPAQLFGALLASNNRPRCDLD